MTDTITPMLARFATSNENVVGTASVLPTGLAVALSDGIVVGTRLIAVAVDAGGVRTGEHATSRAATTNARTRMSSLPLVGLLPV